MMDWLSTVPTTNLRIVVSIGCLVATCVMTLIRWTEPPSGWLLLLGAALSLDVTQWHLKRKTTFAPTSSKPSEEAGT